ncbi:hypothetical protein P9B97_02255 [Bacillus paralicheniformis]|uniref:hypothetical protein n=1 Tax=Bacillus paralicheniformis TaxID=1648923 RepID=UPI002DBB68F5|nr:hypothetical protein [Bacillus paralicheniformis]MEC1087717.1 hypothetical protein [Bacillus paralicheniformis]MEC1108786.1 hypothetical protein [Bacillus paralicheniformis]MEC1137158.1 hypothetical protein [Bacillus paralicheniformis]MEC1148431.1 hypothetical protein [Bacillus paralicheniformis]MEC1151063.1 hypothetical protein [Bacillus paralicheniformis]
MQDNPNPKFSDVNRPRWGSNDDINNIQGHIDFVRDEYGNYYTPFKLTTKSNKLLKVSLMHVLYDEAFATILDDEMLKEYRYSYLGDLLLERMNGHIKELEVENRRIFTVQDLIDNGTEVSFLDITHKLKK